MKRIDRSPVVFPAIKSDFADNVGMAGYEGSIVDRHALFAPLHYESNYAYPLLVWLHGPGDSETQLRRVMPLVSMRNYVAVAPRGTAGGTASGYGWLQDEQAVAAAAQRVAHCVATVQERFHIAPNRIFLAGYDEGGSTALRLALLEPWRYAGAASLGGPFPHGHRPLRGLEGVRRLPLLLTTSRDSRKYPQQLVVRDLQLLHAAGMSLTLRQYPCGDELTTNMLTDLDRWIMRQVCPDPTSSPSPPDAPF